MATETRPRRRRRARSESDAPLIRCDGPCEELHVAGWLIVYRHGAYCRRCIVGAMAEDRAIDRRVELGDPAALGDALARAGAYIESPRPFSESALALREWLRLDGRDVTHDREAAGVVSEDRETHG